MPPGITRQPVASRTRPAFSVGSWVAMAVTLSPEMPTSARNVSVAVTTVPLRITVSKRICAPLECFSIYTEGPPHTPGILYDGGIHLTQVTTISCGQARSVLAALTIDA